MIILIDRDIMKMIFAMDNLCVVATHFVVCHGGNLVERAELPLDSQALRVHMDIRAVHDFLYCAVLKLYLILDLLILCLVLVLNIRDACGRNLFAS